MYCMFTFFMESSDKYNFNEVSLINIFFIVRALLVLFKKKFPAYQEEIE